MQDNIDMEPLHKLFIYRKKLVKPYIERLLKWMDGITYMMSALLILTLVYEHGFLISFEEMEVINMLYHFVWIVFLVDISLHLLLNFGHEAEVPGTGVDTESDALSDFDSGYFP